MTFGPTWGGLWRAPCSGGQWGTVPGIEVQVDVDERSAAPVGERRQWERPRAAGRAAYGSMSDADTLLWTIGRDPRLRSPITAVVRLASMPDMDRLVDRIERLTRREPRLRSTVVENGHRPGNPRWEEDPEFELARHLTRVAAPSPATFGTVLDLAARMAMVDFDVQFPLWEAAVVEGVDGDGAAVIIKVHHAVIDGVAGIGLISTLLDDEPDPPARPVGDAVRDGGGPPTTGRPEPGDGPPGATTGVRAPAGPPDRIVRAVTGRLAEVFVPLERAATAFGAYPRASLRSALAMAKGAIRLVAPAPTPVSPLLGARGLGRQFGAFDVPFADLHDAAKSNDCTVNDVFVAAVLGGLRRYHERHGMRVGRLRILMPISIRTEGDGGTGNRFVPARVLLPLEIVDPRHRIRRVRELTGTFKRDPALGLSDLVARVLSRLPAAATIATFGSMLLGVDAVATNVPGPPSATWLAGAEVERFFAFAPTSGAAANIALTTVGPAACFGVNMDNASIPDGQVFMSCLEAGVEEVLATAGVGRQPRAAAPVTSAEGDERLRSGARHRTPAG